MIVCLGDVVTDIVVRPEGTLRRGTDTEATIVSRRGGSAANVAVSVVEAGGRARFVGGVGADVAGRGLLASLRAAGVEVAVHRAGRSGTVVVVLDETGERSFFTDRGACIDLPRLPRRALDGAAWLHVPAYSLDGEPLASTARLAVRRARRQGVRVSVDASSLAVLETIGAAAIAALEADILFANADEAALLAAAGSLDSYAATVVVKDGPAGATLHRAGRAPLAVPVPAPGGLSDVPDSTGAGDAFAAGTLVALINRKPLRAAIVAGHRHAAAHLRRLGAR